RVESDEAHRGLSRPHPNGLRPQPNAGAAERCRQRELERVQIALALGLEDSLEQTPDGAEFDEPRDVREPVNELVDQQLGAFARRSTALFIHPGTSGAHATSANPGPAK